MLITFFILSLALILDYLFGEPKSLHPLVGFGKLASYVESKLNYNDLNSIKIKLNNAVKLKGTLSWFCLVLPLPLLYFLIHQESVVFYMLDAVVLYSALGLSSLKQHAMNIYKPLAHNDLIKAQQKVALIVSRQTNKLDEQAISRATVESLLENANDAVIASLFWFVIGGAPLVILHRLANTLDAMWGYKNHRFFNFGWFAARSDDFLGWPSAKISAFVMVLSSPKMPSIIINRLSVANKQSKHYKSLNGGLVMATGACILNIRLGGMSYYDGMPVESVALGRGRLVNTIDIKRSVKLLNKACVIFLLVYLLLALGNYFITGIF